MPAPSAAADVPAPVAAVVKSPSTGAPSRSPATAVTIAANTASSRGADDTDSFASTVCSSSTARPGSSACCSAIWGVAEGKIEPPPEATTIPSADAGSTTVPATHATAIAFSCPATAAAAADSATAPAANSVPATPLPPTTAAAAAAASPHNASSSSIDSSSHPNPSCCSGRGLKPSTSLGFCQVSIPWELLTPPALPTPRAAVPDTRWSLWGECPPVKRLLHVEQRVMHVGACLMLLSYVLD
ncbi:unnamed protein product [Closterium sp. NIES-53]